MHTIDYHTTTFSLITQTFLALASASYVARPSDSFLGKIERVTATRVHYICQPVRGNKNSQQVMHREKRRVNEWQVLYGRFDHKDYWSSLLPRITHYSLLEAPVN